MGGIHLHGLEYAPGELREPDCLGNLRLSNGQGAGLVEDYGIYPVSHLQGIGILYKYALVGAVANAGDNRSRGCKAEGAGAGDYKDRHHVQQGLCETCVRNRQPSDESGDGNQQYNGHEYGRHLVDGALNGRFAGLGLADHADNARKNSVRAGLLGEHLEHAVAVHCAGEHFLSLIFLHGHRLSG